MHRTWLVLVALAVVALAFSGCSSDPGGGVEDASDAEPDPARKGLALVPVADGFQQPLLVTHAGDERIFVVEQGGKVIVLDGASRATYLDISGQVSGGSEQGLLGIAFDPGDPRRLFVSYTDASGDSVLERWTAGATSATRSEELLRVDQPDSNHNGGHILFGPDGMLYYGLGDGGGANDIHSDGSTRNAQNLGNMLGKLHRIDVSGSGYTIPPDNPFVGQAGARGEIWAYGLRNPWRFSFDAANDDLWIGDVGQDAWEEIDRQPTDSGGGEDYGWPDYEGTHQYLGANLQHVLPVAEYANQGEDCSITGGHVARDPNVPELEGAYLFADYCSGKIWTLRPDGAGWQASVLLDTDYRISSFGEDIEGRLYVVNHNGGAIYRFA